MSEIILKPGREKSVLRRHPWIFSGAVDAVHGSPQIGSTVEVASSSGEFLARAAYNPNSTIIGRIWTWDYDEQVDPEFLGRKLKGAIGLRQKAKALIHSNAVRWIHGESDGLPGLILDQYDDVCVVQFLTAGAEYWKANLVEMILKNTNARVLYERSDVDVRQLEGLPMHSGLLYGNLPGEPIEIVENGLKFLVDIIQGHKTGFYLDQRDNRLLARNIAEGRKVLDCFAYTGGFTVNCLEGNAESVTMVETSANALYYGRRNLSINKFSTTNVEFIEQDVFKFLRILRDQGVTFDLVILDPPKFAPTASQAERAARGYKDINLLALKILRSGGYLLTFSCSGGVNEDLYQKIVAGAALDAGVEANIIKRLHQAVDHPVGLNFPEGAYLKGFLIQKQD